MFTCKLSLVFLCVMALCALSYSLPAPSSSRQETHRPLSPRLDNARKMWNGAKRAYKERLVQRTRREVVNTNDVVIDQAVLANITGQKFMVNLYKNLTNSSVHEKIEANTIRSFTYIKPEGSDHCGIFNFTLSATNSSEYMLNAFLHLYAFKPHTPDVTVKITANLPNGTKLQPVVTDQKELTSDGYVVFDVTEITRQLLADGETHAVFQVVVYKTEEEFNEGNRLDCDAVEFINTDFTDDTKPIFVVYSYNYKIAKINYREVADSVIANIVTAQNPALDPASVQQNGNQGRRKRQTSQPACKVNNLSVDGGNIFNFMVGSDAADFRVTAPASYNAGICGGTCENILIPDSQTNNHAPLVYLLIERPSFRQQHLDEFGYTFQRCCAPVRYGPLTVFSMGDGTASINVIDNMIIKECECIDIVELPSGGA